MKTVGIIGCGAIGTLIAKAVQEKTVPCDKLILLDIDASKAEKLKKALNVPTVLVRNVEQMIRLKPSVIVEAASQQAAKEFAPRIIAEDKDLIVMSVGALLDMNLKSPKVHIPSGAVGGLDAISSADLAGVDEVVLVTRKSPKILDLTNREEKMVFEGDAREAVRRFPKEMNVAATLALTVSPERVRVQVISDPKVERNVHKVRVRWKHGEMFLKFSNDPHPDNPKTSALAAWSAIKLLIDVLEKHG